MFTKKLPSYKFKFTLITSTERDKIWMKLVNLWLCLVCDWFPPKVLGKL
jgi:hypothetical protein